ncbi:hypothetical protein ACVINX_007106 [Bradyrhizobium diazoefficiens]
MVWAAVAVIDCAVLSMVEEAFESPPTSSVTLASNAAGELVERLRAAHLAVVLGLLLGGEPVGPDHVVLEHLHGRGHRPDLVGALGAGDLLGNVAFGKPRHPRGQADDGRADAAAHRHDEADAGDQHGDKAEERDGEAGACRRGGARQDLLRIVVKRVADLDDGAEAALRRGVIGVHVVFVLAADRTVLHQLELAAELLDIDRVELLQRSGDVRRRCRIAAQFQQRHHDLVVAALRAADLGLLGVRRRFLAPDEVLVQAGVEAADVAQRHRDVGVARLPVGVAVEDRHAADLLVEQRGHGAVEHGVVGDDLLGGVLARLRRSRERLVDGLAQRGEFRIDAVDVVAGGGAVVERAGKVLA